MLSWTSYPSIFNIGHKALEALLKGPVNVEEKVDGSQFSFGKTEDGELRVRSKGAVMILDAPEKMFAKAVITVKELSPLLVPGWTYRAEFLAKPKHNTLAYERVPQKNLILFDVNTGLQNYLFYGDKVKEAERLELEVVPALALSTTIHSAEEFRAFLDTQSVLGGQKIEGVVVKPADYDVWGPDKKVLMGKFVSEAFKEIHGNTWRKHNPTSGDLVEQISVALTTPARWQKAVQHLTEAGELESSPRDIGLLMKEVVSDIEKEATEEIQERLFRYAWPHIKRRVTAGLPEWYKEQLLKKQFEETA